MLKPISVGRILAPSSCRILKPGWRTGPPSRPTATNSLPRFSAYKPRRYNVTSTPPRGAESDPTVAPASSTERWITVLENTATAPWLNIVPQDHEDKLKRAYTLLFQIVLYLGRPQEEDKAQQFLVAFESAIVPTDSEIGRARKAIATITRAVVQDITSVPISSSLRTEKSGIFDILGALQALHDVHLVNGDGEVENWTEFWSRAQSVVLGLGMKLAEEGYGLDLDELQKEEKGTGVEKP